MSLDYDAVMRQRYDEAEVCRHGYRAESCGKCHDPDVEDYEPIACAHGFDMGVNCDECQVLAQEQLAAAFVKALDRIRMHEDETKGVALAARFGG
jgi:hypothetical protein